jgi:GT2 family glycosyltransferase
MSSGKVCTVVLNWNTYELTKACIESLLRATYSNHEIILIDNASADGSGARLHQDYPDLPFIQNERNLGFARGCNVAIRRALELGADYVLLLNSDTKVEPNFLEPLVELAESDRTIGLISGKILLMGKPSRIWFAGAEVGPLHHKIRGTRELDDGRYDRVEEVTGCTGAMMFITRSVLETVGLLPEEYFFGMEEWDYSLAARRAGYRLYYCPKSLVHHHADGSHINNDPKFVYCGIRNRIIFKEKYLPRVVHPLWRILYKVYVQHLAHLRLNLGKEAMHAYRTAQRAAFRDHRRAGRPYIEEQDLLNFEREFRATLATGQDLAQT